MLLQKIRRIGINGKIYKFIENFLTNRSFKLKIDENFSSPILTHSGVPQGSILGPLFFLIFINDLPDYLPDGIKIKMYAEDVKLYIEHKNDNRIEILSDALIALEKWSKQNGIGISLKKCFVLYIGKQNLKIPYFLNGERIEETKCMRDLGVLIDSKLSFSDQFKKIIKNAYLVSHQLLRSLKIRGLDKLKLM